MQHGTYRISLTDEGVHAVCECGWRSDRFASAGLAGACWDQHRERASSDDGADGGVGRP